MSGRLLSALALLLAGSVSPAFAQATAAALFVSTGRDTLRGLPGVEVVVESVPPELGAAGLAAGTIRADIERRLRGSGVTLYNSQQQNASQAKAYLYLHLNALEVPGGTTAVAVQLQLRQTVRSVVTASSIVNAMTWDQHNIFALTRRDGASLTAAVMEMVDEFASDWRRTR